jgi:AraC family transcriptional regulator of adaptative response/methylated-DNA-[protein]-cysteine methyltransferase
MPTMNTIAPRIDDGARWRAVLARDAAMNGQFVYAVRSTGIYCRPSCPSRQPRRDNVRFYCDADAAEADGFRACKRCKPREAVPGDRAASLVKRACAFIDARIDGPPTLEELARHLGLSPFHVQRTFTRVMGVSPRAYADERRLGRLKHRLKRGAGVTDALYESGYGSSSRLYETAKAKLGMTPATYGRGAKDVRIDYAIVSSALGPMIVAGTPRGLSYVAFDDDEAALEAALRSEYPHATLARDDGGLGRYVKPIVAHVAGRPQSFALPLDVQATAFQRRVWQALQAIPVGETRTYQQLANRVGAPKAARAVGSACARNPVSIVVPCHRAIRRDGTMGGYAWGLKRKERLLAMERAHRAAKADRR